MRNKILANQLKQAYNTAGKPLPKPIPVVRPTSHRMGEMQDRYQGMVQRDYNLFGRKGLNRRRTTGNLYGYDPEDNCYYLLRKSVQFTVGIDGRGYYQPYPDSKCVLINIGGNDWALS